jgi:hypothetical protein
MKKTIVVVGLLVMLFTGCGDTDYLADILENMLENQPQKVDMFGFTCLGVNNETQCSSIQIEPGIWDSGEVAISGNSYYKDYLNMEVTNNRDVSALFYVYSLITIDGCGDDIALATPVYGLEPYEKIHITFNLWNYICARTGNQQIQVSIYNGNGFNPDDYANPTLFPHDDLIEDATLLWENTSH